MSELQHVVVRTQAGAVLVRFACPGCQRRREHKIGEAGQSSRCDQCRQEYVVPGRDQLDALIEQLRLQRELESLRPGPPLAPEQPAYAPATPSSDDAWIDLGDAPATYATPRNHPSIVAARALETARKEEQPDREPPHSRYAMLYWYMWFLRAAGWIVMAIPLCLLAAIIAIAVLVSDLDREMMAILIGWAIGGIIAGIPAGLGMLALSTGIQLALDAAADLARIADDE